MKMSAFLPGHEAKPSLPPSFLSHTHTHTHVSVTWPQFPVTDAGWSGASGSLQQGRIHEAPPGMDSLPALYCVTHLFDSSSVKKPSEATSASLHGQRGHEREGAKRKVGQESRKPRPPPLHREHRSGSQSTIERSISFRSFLPLQNVT